jgi:hypothetical protein
MKCNNCLRTHKKLPSVCVPAVLLGYIVHDREGGITNERQDDPFIEAEAIKYLSTTLNVDQLWDDIAEILDKIEEGYYDYAEDE